MSTTIIITLCILVLIAYLFDLTTSKTKIPSVILLLVMGGILKYVMVSFDLMIPKLQEILTIMGTIGLILIVLDGSLELDFSKEKFPLIKKSIIVAVGPMLLFILIASYVIYNIKGGNFRQIIINVIPLSVISSAIAIPTVRSLGKKTKDFIVFESSLSDIVGVLLFNFFALNLHYGIGVWANSALQMLILLILSFIVTIILAYLMGKIDHHIKFVPIILLIILIYALSKVFHLSGLVFILIFGLFLGNIQKMEKIPWVNRLKIDAVAKEVTKFKDLVVEGTFLVRSLFFILFGYMIDVNDLINTRTLIWSLSITAGIFALRSIFLYINKLPQFPLLFIAPRGLITILLFFSVEAADKVDVINDPMLIQIIVITALIMMTGMMLTTGQHHRKKKLKRLEDTAIEFEEEIKEEDEF